MKDIVVYGAGGFAREVMMLLEDINLKTHIWSIQGFIDDNESNQGKEVNGYPILGGKDWLENKEINVVIAIAEPYIKEKVVLNLEEYEGITYPNIIHPSVKVHHTNEIGIGNVICEGNILTCNIKLDNFVTVNLNSTIGHDVYIKSYTTILPNSSISGNVLLEERVDFGTNATIIQGINVGENSIVGAGATVVKDLPANCTAVGSPAKPIKFHE